VLEKIAALVDFSEAERRLEATYSELGRPGHRAAVLLRVMLLQHLYGLSDPQAETQLGDRLSFQKFVGLRAGEAVPDETTICRFRQRMITAGLHEHLLEMLNAQLAAAGYLREKARPELLRLQGPHQRRRRQPPGLPRPAHPLHRR
jgi:IS5 family transposase